MSKPFVTDVLWAVEPLLPPERLKPKGDRSRVPDRATLTTILLMLLSGIFWEMLPLEASPLAQWLHAALVKAGFSVMLLETRHVRAPLSVMSKTQ